MLTRRFFNKYGLNIQNSSKHAQVTTDEVHGLDSVAWVFVLDMLKERQRFCKDASDMFGETFECSFSDVWQIEYDAYVQRTLAVEEGEKEETKDDDVE